jgi:SAM-dependent methyltransferase
MSIQQREPDEEERAPFSVVFGHALRGQPCTVVGLGAEPEPLPVHLWRQDADDEDVAMLGYCIGHTVDLGCGPGRLAAALAVLGHTVLGVDVVREAVEQTVQRGVAGLRRNVFDRLPGEGRWHTALLADGNIGIGGDPRALLRRAGCLIDEGGRVVVELAGPGVPMDTTWAVLRSAGVRSARFRWATLGVDDIEHLATSAGFAHVEVHRFGARRWCAVLSGHSGADA